MDNLIQDDKGIIEAFNTKKHTELTVTPVITKNKKGYSYIIVFTTKDVYSLETEEKTQPLFSLPWHNESFFLNLVEIIKPIILDNPDYSTLIKIIPYFSNPYFKNLYETIVTVRYEEFDYAKTMGILAKINTVYTNNATEQVVKEFVEKYPDPETLYKKLKNNKQNLRMACFYPAFHNLNRIEHNIASSFIYDKKSKFTIDSVENFKILCKLIYVYLDKENQKTKENIKDIQIPNNHMNIDDDRKKTVLKLFDLTSETLNYLNNLTNKQFLKIIDYTNFENNGMGYVESAVLTNNFTAEECEKILAFKPVKLSYYVNTVANFINLSENVSKKSKLLETYKYLSKGLDKSSYFRGSQRGYYYNPFILKQLTDYLNSLTTVTSGDFEMIHEFVTNENRFSHTQNIGVMHIYFFIERIGFENFLHVTNDLKQTDTILTKQQWQNYIDNYEEYKDLPVSWWVELI